MRLRRAKSLRAFAGVLVAAVVLGGFIAHVPRGRGIRHAVYPGYWSHVVRIHSNRQSPFPALNSSGFRRYQPELNWRPLVDADSLRLPGRRRACVIRLRAPPSPA
jgi:hypothetical protein